MKEPNYGSVSAYSVQDAAQAKLLSEPKSFTYFAPFLARTCTVSRAAKEVGCNVDTMLYRVRTFLKAGLLKVVNLEKRSGRPIKHYRSTHDAYFVPFATKPFADLEEEARQTLRSHEDAIAKALAQTRRTLGRQGHRVFRDEHGEVRSHSAGSEHYVLDYDALPTLPAKPEFKGRAVAEVFSDTLSLSEDEAKTLLSQLYQLWRENKREQKGLRTPYLLRVVMVPLESS